MNLWFTLTIFIFIGYRDIRDIEFILLCGGFFFFQLLDQLVEFSCVLARELGIGALLGDGAVFHNINIGEVREILQSVGDEYSGFVFELGQNEIVEYLGGDVVVQGGEAIIDDIDVRVRVDSSGETDPLLLTSREIDASLSDFGHVSSLELLDILVQFAQSQALLVLLRFEI